MLRPARPARSLSAALAGTAVAAALLVVPAHAAPVAARSAAATVVTPPTQVSRAALVRLMRNAGKATDAGLVAGARMRTTVRIGGMTLSSTGRTRDGLSSMRGPNGNVTLTDFRSGRGYMPIADAVAGLEVTPEELAAALASLGKPGATWAVITPMAGAPSGTAGAGSDLVRQPRTASTWTWKRAHGITTWRIGAPRAALPTALVVALDKRQRIVRETLTASSTRPIKLTTRVSIAVRYGAVAPIVLPTDAQTVSFDALLKALAGSQMPPGVAAVGAQIAALRSMTGR